ncbi:MAG: FecR domain-containing protein [Bacteroidetes bacterium]|nr:FecR domain-containing protein [Bacteroidota bacterium]
MASSTGNRKLIFFIIIVLLLAVAAFFWFRRKPATEKVLPPAPPVAANGTPVDTIPAPKSYRLLPDSIEAYLLANTKLETKQGYPAKRELNLDGDAFLLVTAANGPLTIHTKLFTIIVKGRSALRVMAPSAEKWAEVDVLEGNVIIRKAYPSQFNEPDTLHGGQMQMINRDIDLMEKETFDGRTLKAWSEKLRPF